ADDPAFNKVSKSIETLSTDQKELNRKLTALSTLDAEFQQVSKDVAALKSGGGGAAGEALKSVDTRLERGENELKTLKEAVIALQAQTAESAKIVASR